MNYDNEIKISENIICIKQTLSFYLNDKVCLCLDILFIDEEHQYLKNILLFVNIYLRIILKKIKKTFDFFGNYGRIILEWKTII